MKVGEDLNGYVVVTKPTNDGAGKCLWAFAEKDGREYFVKEFLDPKRPRPESMGDPAAKRQLMAQCEAFERRHRSVIRRLDPADLDAGNLVTALEFFCRGTRYYKITRRLYPVNQDPYTLEPAGKKVLLGTLLDSIVLLHRLGIVHSDLKPQNILLHQPAGSDLVTAKVIDFDDSYVAGSPPDPQEIGGDARYAAPEWIRYAAGDSSTGSKDMTTAADLFALGLIVHQYLTGALPTYGAAHASPAEAVNAGERPVLDPRLDRQVAALLRRSLDRVPSVRPAASQLRRELGDQRLFRLAELDTRAPTAGRSRIRYGPSGDRPLEPAPRPANPPPGAPARPSRVRINLGDRVRADGRTGS